VERGGELDRIFGALWGCPPKNVGKHQLLVDISGAGYAPKGKGQIHGVRWRQLCSLVERITWVVAANSFSDSPAGVSGTTARLL
jgi:hypothetical protein